MQPESAVDETQYAEDKYNYDGPEDTAGDKDDATGDDDDYVHVGLHDLDIKDSVEQGGQQSHEQRQQKQQDPKPNKYGNFSLGASKSTTNSNTTTTSRTTNKDAQEKNLYDSYTSTPDATINDTLAYKIASMRERGGVPPNVIEDLTFLHTLLVECTGVIESKLGDLLGVRARPHHITPEKRKQIRFEVG